MVAEMCARVVQTGKSPLLTMDWMMQADIKRILDECTEGAMRAVGHY